MTTEKLTELISANHKFAQDASRALFVFQEGSYRPDGRRLIEREVKCLLTELQKYWTPAYANNVAKYLLVDAPELWGIPPCDEINVLNGILNVETRTLRPHTADFLSPIQIRAKFDPNAVCLEWSKFISEVFSEEDRLLAGEIVGDLIVPDRSIQKAVLLIGGGGNGKTTFIEGLRAFVGPNNVSTVALQTLGENRFASAQLQGKLANFYPDLPSTSLQDSSVFKGITGGDEIRGEQKFGHPFSFRPFCRLVFGANQFPIAKDSSDAYFDRWLVVQFERSFRNTSADIPRAVLDKKLADSREQSGLLNLALDGLDRLRKNGGFTESSATRKALKEFRAISDDLSDFMERTYTFDPNGTVPVEVVRNAFNADRSKHGRPPLADSQFGREISQRFPQLNTVRVGNPRKRHYQGIRRGTNYSRMGEH